VFINEIHTLQFPDSLPICTT